VQAQAKAEEEVAVAVPNDGHPVNSSDDECAKTVWVGHIWHETATREHVQAIFESQSIYPT
jgi:hypothetical protein